MTDSIEPGWAELKAFLKRWWARYFVGSQPGLLIDRYAAPPSPEAEREARHGSDPCGCPRNSAGDIRCHVCGERVNIRCWKCGTRRGQGICPLTPSAATIPDPTCTCGHARSEHAYVVVDGPCGARSDGCQKYDHDCLRDRVEGQQHCITCHQNGHTYVAHLGIFGIEPRIDTGALVEETIRTSSTERES